MNRRTLRPLICALLTILVLASSAQAGWWIFGKSPEEVGTKYLYINGIAFDEKDTKITLYKDMLTNGNVVIRGKAATKQNKVGAVQVSVDNKTNWEKAKLADDGSFEYTFQPDIDTTYDIYVKILDTTGKSNNVEATHKQVVVTDQKMGDTVKEALDAMIQAYKDEDARKFMSYVSPDFAGDDANLDRAIRKDFTFFDNIELTYTISSIATGSGKVYVSIFYNRFVTSTKSGANFKDTGTTEFVFKFTDSGPKVFSMKNPLIFGLSDAENVATGSILVGNTQVIHLGSNGTVTLGAVNAGGGGGNGDPREVQITSITGIKHHEIVLHLNCPNALHSWDIQIEESDSPGGPWENVMSGPFNWTMTLSSDRIAVNAMMLYYRVRILDDVTFGPWSDVESWDNN